MMSCGSNAQANILPLPIHSDAITSVYTHFTHTSHPNELLSSLELNSPPKDLGASSIYSPPKDFSIYTLPEFSGREKKLAAACFVTDTRDCSDYNFSSDGDTSDPGHPGGGNPDDYELDDEERCKKEGYTLTSCAENSTPANFCPYDSSYFEKCTCPAEYTTCEVPYYGEGEACGDKYASCKKDTKRLYCGLR